MNFDEQMAAIRRELERQDAVWNRASETFADLGNVSIAVPSDFFDELERVTSVSTRPVPTARVAFGLRA